MGPHRAVAKVHKMGGSDMPTGLNAISHREVVKVGTIMLTAPQRAVCPDHLLGGISRVATLVQLRGVVGMCVRIERGEGWALLRIEVFVVKAFWPVGAGTRASKRRGMIVAASCA